MQKLRPLGFLAAEGTGTRQAQEEMGPSTEAGSPHLGSLRHSCELGLSKLVHLQPHSEVVPCCFRSFPAIGWDGEQAG